MNIKKILMCLFVFGYINIAMGLQVGEKINENSYAKIYDDIAISISSYRVPGYRVIIDAISKKFNRHPQNFSEALRPLSITVEKNLWSFTSDQLPLTENDCFGYHLIVCEKDIEGYCYKNCLVKDRPTVIAYDKKNKKIYLNYGTYDIGTGGGPAILFVADINKREIKRLKRTTWGQSAAISPSTRYLVLHDESYISIYDTQKDSWFDMNKSENDYSGERQIIHDLILKKWLNDNQFVYIDKTYYFTRRPDPTSFISAKEVTYDIPGKTMLSEKKITENEYNEFIKKMDKDDNKVW